MTNNKNNQLHKNPLLAAKYELLMKYFKAPNLIELRINQPGEVIQFFADGKKKITKDSKIKLTDLETLAGSLASSSGGQKFNRSNPIVSCKLPDGSRVQIMGHDTVGSGFAMVVRIKREKQFSLADFGVDDKTAEEVAQAIKDQKTILVSGGTGTGKTTLTNALLEYIPLEERLVTIEGVEELKVPHKDALRLFYSENETSISRKSANDLLRASLRLSPDRILVGEIHNENAMAFIDAINTGHEGSIATVHANNPRGAIVAIISKILKGSANMNEAAIRELQAQMCRDIYGIVQIKKNHRTLERTAYFEKLDKYRNDELVAGLVSSGASGD